MEDTLSFGLVNRVCLPPCARMDGGAIVPLFEAGFVTVRWLDINPQTRVEMRATLAQHPFNPRR